HPRARVGRLRELRRRRGRRAGPRGLPGSDAGPAGRRQGRLGSGQRLRAECELPARGARMSDAGDAGDAADAGGSELPDYVRRNREYWDRQAADYVAGGRRAWASQEPAWGVYHVPESTLHLLPDDLAGKDVVELGCGTAYVSAWLARRGARPVG